MPELLGLGSYGRRSLAALLAVALTTITVLLVVTIVGIDLTRSAATRTQREGLTRDMALAAAAAYETGGRWELTALDQAQVQATEAGGHLVVLDQSDTIVFGGPLGPGFGTRALAEPIVVEGQQVGEVSVGFPTGAGAQAAPSPSLGWLVAATTFAMGVALLLAIHLTRRLTTPLTDLTETTRAFASGDRAARASISGPGEIGELAVAFNAMADEVSHVEQARQHLSADVAHELRTPLTALQGGLEELCVDPGLADERSLETLHDQAVRMGRILNDLSELSQAEGVGPDLQPRELDLATLVDQILAAWSSRVRAAGLQIRAELEEGVRTRADPDRMHQVVGNLLANAARHCRSGDQVVVSVRSQDDTALIEVRDSGPGIASDQVPYAFDRFWRGASEETPGSGLGLPVARALVQAQGGRIVLASTLGEGTTVTIRLPLVR